MLSGEVEMKKNKYSVFAGLMIAAGVLLTPHAAYVTGGREVVAAAALSADNSLGQLQISGAELSPEFYYSTVKYTATVPYDVTEVEVTAKTSNAMASIVSISGNENLNVGENTIKIVVAAENGNEATYTITLTRLSEDEAAGADAADEETSGSTTSEEEAAESVVSEPEDDEAARLEEETDLVQLSYGDYGLTVLNPPEDQIPDTVEQVTLEVDGTVVSNAYQYVSGIGSTSDNLSDYYFLYGTDSLDASGWFMYDSRVGMFGRFLGNFLGTDDGTDAGNSTDDADTESSVSTAADSDEYAQLLANYNNAAAALKQLEQKLRLMTAVFLFIIAILLIIIFSILFAKRKSDFDDGEVFEDEDEPIKKEKPLETIPVTRASSGMAKKVQRPEEPENLDDRDDLTDSMELTNEPEPEKALSNRSSDEKTTKKKKRRDSILAYLGLDDDLPLDYGDEIEDEDEAEPESKSEGGKGRKLRSGAGDINGKDKHPTAVTDDAAKAETKQSRAEDTKGDDIEFIDL
jgi:hypothetical protein